MKRVVLLLIALFLVSDFAAAKENRISLPLKEVKVYLSGAELTHLGDIQLNKGINTVIVDNISDNIKANSINVSLGGKAILVSVTERVNYLKDLERTQDIILLEDSIETTNLMISQRTNENAVLDAEADLLVSNKIISGKDKNITVAELQQMANYFNTRLLDIKNSKYTISKELDKLKETLNRLNRQLTEINQKRNKKVNEIVLTITSEITEKIDVKVKYFNDNAGWIPFYDVRVADINSDVEFMHKANVWQSTGISWDEVDLIISTRNPTISGSFPVISSVKLDFVDSYKARTGYVGFQNVVQDEASPLEPQTKTKKSKERYEESKVIAPKPVQNMLSVDYVPSVKYTIPSDSKQYKVDLQYTDIKANYEYYSVPKLQPDAYLVARISNWENMNLLAGIANVYFENSYIGQTVINPNITSDTLSLSLGIDKNVLVKREIVKDFTENKFLSSDIERIFAYKITIKNNKKTTIKIILEDLIPISKNEEIQIKLLEDLVDGSLNKSTGFITWPITLEAGKSLEKTFKFSVRHPKEETVSPF